CSATPGYCVTILSAQLQTLLERYQDSEERLPDVDRLLNLIVAPTVFRILFSATPLPVSELHEMIELALQP
ncbi:TetR family transcriptional regulator, partial [Pseudomonas idahonensis]